VAVQRPDETAMHVIAALSPDELGTKLASASGG
jgi:hypothetical protein